jgi:predicted O-methyltransferase YrrM
MRIREIAIVIRNMLLGGNLDSLLVLNDPRAAVQYVAESRFLYRCIFPNGGLPQKPVWEFLGADQVPVVLYSDAAKEWFRPVASYAVDLVSMCMICQILKPKVILEIGTLHGAGALHWAGNAPDAEVYTLDLPESARPALPLTVVDREHVQAHAKSQRQLFEERPEGKRIHCLHGDTANFDFSRFFGKVDLLFIDGAHSYEYVRNDTLRTWACCKPGSVICWHDYGRLGVNGVSKWLHEFAREGRQIYRVQGGSLAYTKI